MAVEDWHNKVETMIIQALPREWLIPDSIIATIRDTVIALINDGEPATFQHLQKTLFRTSSGSFGEASLGILPRIAELLPQYDASDFLRTLAYYYGPQNVAFELSVKLRPEGKRLPDDYVLTDEKYAENIFKTQLPERGIDLMSLKEIASEVERILNDPRRSCSPEVSAKYADKKELVRKLLIDSKLFDSLPGAVQTELMRLHRIRMWQTDGEKVKLRLRDDLQFALHITSLISAALAS